ncbi:MAG TPA: phosphatidate cytidylyltransferase [Solirubrobacterales bacterium]|nr:phosphatidate cytidylyltransferase [Solirubrobacterales bacterium]
MKIDLFDDEMFEEEPQRPERPPREPRKRRRRSSGETAKRVLVALPWIVFAIAITVAGGPVFALAMIAIGIVAVGEFAGIAKRYRPLVVPAYISVAGLIAAAYLGTSYSVLMVLAASVPLLFGFAATARYREGATISLGVSLLAVVWIGVPLAHAVFLRELPDHGAALLIDVLVGTFVADTAAYATGRMFGSHKIAPNLSPNKTIEGLVGGFVIGTMGFWFAGLYQDWLSGVDALMIGAAVAALAPVGDLFESLLKRDLGTKDTGTLFGPHGGLLDRLDAVFFTVVVGYYLSVVVVY